MQNAFLDKSNSPEDSSDDFVMSDSTNNSSVVKEVSTKALKYMCGSSQKESDFIVEYKLPFECSQPVGIAVDKEGNPWVAATRTGHILKFDPLLKRFAENVQIPNWKTRGDFGSMVWGMKFDKNGNLWFTDQHNNAIWKFITLKNKFEIYKIPTNGSYPVEIAFDSIGRVWFSEIFGKKLGVIDPEKAENNTSNGITEYELKNVQFETMGPLTVSQDNKSIWFTTVTFPEGGNIVKFDMNKRQFKVFQLAKGTGVPVGIAEDEQGRLWINDHASNLFFMFNPANGKIVKYSTSLPTSRNTTTTLPYWNSYDEGKIWFNEHEGNAIAYFDIANRTLVEFEIPSRSSLWGNTSNPLKFTLDNHGSIWFTEWTENRLGLLDSKFLERLPLSLSVSKVKVNLDKDQQKTEALQVSIYPKDELSGPVEVTVAGTMSPAGRLWNITGQFSENVLRIKNEDEAINSGFPDTYNVTLWLTPEQDLVKGNYTLTIGARNNGVTYSKVIDVSVT